MITASIAVEDKSLRDELRSSLDNESVQLVAEQPQVSDLSPFIDSLMRFSPDLALIDVGSLHESVAEVIQKIRHAAPKAFLIALNTSADSAVILDSFHAGANEYLIPPVSAGVGAVCQRLQQARMDRGSKGRVMAFLSAKGGCGATTVICHAAAAVAGFHHKVLLADFDILGGTVGFLLKMSPPYSIMDAFRNTERIDENYWRGLISRYEDKMDVVTAPASVAARSQPTPEQIRRVLEFARSTYEWTLIDLGCCLGSTTLVSLETADDLCLVVRPKLADVHQAKGVIQFLLDAGHQRGRIHLILNRVPRFMNTQPYESEEVLGLPVFASLVDKESDLEEACARGGLLPSGNPLALQFIDLARKLSGDKAAARHKFSLFGREQ